MTNIRALWRGYCCRRCGLCTPRTFWHKWHCERCRDEFPFLLGPIPLQSIVDRTFPSFDGHPVINHAWPPDIPYEGPTFRQEYRVDRWRLHAGAELTLLTPTRARNAAQGGADEIWTRLVDDMNRGTVEMRRVRMKGSLLKGWSGGLCRHFFANFGAEYGKFFFSLSFSVPNRILVIIGGMILQGTCFLEEVILCWRELSLLLE